MLPALPPQWPGRDHLFDLLRPDAVSGDVLDVGLGPDDLRDSQKAPDDRLAAVVIRSMRQDGYIDRKRMAAAFRPRYLIGRLA
jgi:hypothetical protein